MVVSVLPKTPPNDLSDALPQTSYEQQQSPSSAITTATINNNTSCSQSSHQLSLPQSHQQHMQSTFADRTITTGYIANNDNVFEPPEVTIRKLFKCCAHGTFCSVCLADRQPAPAGVVAAVLLPAVVPTVATTVQPFVSQYEDDSAVGLFPGFYRKQQQLQQLQHTTTRQLHQQQSDSSSIITTPQLPSSAAATRQPYTCPYCRFACSWRYDLKLHMKQKHGIHKKIWAAVAKNWTHFFFLGTYINKWMCELNTANSDTLLFTSLIYLHKKKTQYSAFCVAHRALAFYYIFFNIKYVVFFFVCDCGFSIQRPKKPETLCICRCSF